MIRTTAVPRSIRTGAAAVSVLGMVALAGCSTTTTADATPTAAPEKTSPSSAPSSTGSAGSASSGAVYKDGTYSADGSYSTPESVEKISVTVTLANDVITNVDVKGTPTKRESEQYQGQFIGGISAEVVGKKIDEISVSRVAGSSLTSGGFNKAIDEIKVEAKA